MNSNGNRKPQHGDDFTEYRIDLGSGSKGNRCYKVLKHLLRDVIGQQRKQLNYDDANILHMYRNTSRFRVALSSPIYIYMEPEEWGALSRGLRALGTPAASSMYQRLSNSKIET